MRLAYITSIPTHHQLPVGRAFQRLLGDDFSMAFLSPVDPERLALGWGSDFSECGWVVRAWESAEQLRRVRQSIREADVVVYGLVPMALMRERILSGKLTFRYSERLFKHGVFLGALWWLRRMVRDFWPLNLPNHHLLAAGAYCAQDYRRVRTFCGRSWKWGYFTEVAAASPPVRPHESRGRLLWAGRMIRWKKVNLIIEAARRLKTACPDFSVELIGEGPEKNRLLALSDRFGLADRIRFLPSLPFAEIPAAMRQADIYIMPSDFSEGWGAVINEAMAAGCCVVSSNGPGAAPWLIEHGKTGFIFESGNVGQLCSILEPLIRNPDDCHAVGRRAWETMHDLWTPQAAAQRFVALASAMVQRTPPPAYPSGPCSPCC